MNNYKKTVGYRTLACFVAISFLMNSVAPAGVYAAGLPKLPKPGSLLSLSAPFHPSLIRGLKINPTDPFQFDVLVENGDSKLNDKEYEENTTKLVKYFLASLTVKDANFWVNLSPHEKDRIISSDLAVTEMGRDLLAQDYLLKQVVSSLTYPESTLGKKFWDRVYKKAYELYGTTEVPLNTFNKVWIVPDTAELYEKGDTVVIVNSRLKVMLDEDYLALNSNLNNRTVISKSMDNEKAKQISNLSSVIAKEVLLPEIEKEVNEGKNFAPIREIYNSVILANWYKQRLKDSLLGQIYVDQNKTSGIDIDDKTVKDQIYEQYLEAFRKGVYNYIRDDFDPYRKVEVPRKYFSGGADLNLLQTSFAGTAPRIVNWRHGQQQIPPAVTTAVDRVMGSGVESGMKRAAVSLRGIPGTGFNSAPTGAGRVDLETAPEIAVGMAFSGSSEVDVGLVSARGELLSSNNGLLPKLSSGSFDEKQGLTQLAAQIANTVGDRDKRLLTHITVSLPDTRSQNSPFPEGFDLSNQLGRLLSANHGISAPIIITPPLQGRLAAETISKTGKLAYPDGAVFSMGADNKGAVKVSGLPFTDNYALNEMGHAFVLEPVGDARAAEASFRRLEQNQQKQGKYFVDRGARDQRYRWSYKGNQFRGETPALKPGQRNFSQMFSRPQLAVAFTDFAAIEGGADYAADMVAEHVLETETKSPREAADFVDLVRGEGRWKESLKRNPQDQASRQVAFDKLLNRGIPRMMKAGDEKAAQFVTEIGYQMGRSFSSMFSQYPDEKWIDHFVVASDIFRPEPGQRDVLLEGIHDGVRAGLKNAPGFDAGRIELVVRGLERSNLSDRSGLLLAATPTINEIAQHRSKSSPAGGRAETVTTWIQRSYNNTKALYLKGVASEAARVSGIDRAEIERELDKDIYEPLLKAVSVIEENRASKAIRPAETRLRVFDKDAPGFIPSNLGRPARVGFLPMKGDPWQLGHVFAILEAIASRKLDKVVVMVDNSDPVRKPTLLSLVIREATTKVLLSRLGDLVQYTPLPKEHEELFAADGETVLFKLINLNEGLNIEWDYMFGSDHRYWEIKKKDQATGAELTLPDTTKKLWGFQTSGLYGYKLGTSPKVNALFIERIGEPLDEATMADLHAKSGLGINKIFQPMDTSSTRVRGKKHYWTVPYETYEIAQAFKLWGFEDAEVSPGAGKTWANQQKDVGDELIVLMKVGSEGTADDYARTRDKISAKLDGALGVALNQADNYLMRELMSTLSDLKKGEAPALRTKSERLAGIREQLFQRSEQLVASLQLSGDTAARAGGEIKSAPTGGIDFNDNNFNLVIKRDGSGVPLPISMQDLRMFQIDGLEPVITKISPVTKEDLPVLLGQSEPVAPATAQASTPAPEKTLSAAIP